MPLLGPIGGGLGGGAPPSAAGVAAGGGGGAASEALTTSLEFLWLVLWEKRSMDGVEVGLVVELGVGVRTNPEAADAMLQVAIFTLSALSPPPLCVMGVVVVVVFISLSLRTIKGMEIVRGLRGLEWCSWGL